MPTINYSYHFVVTKGRLLPVPRVYECVGADIWKAGRYAACLYDSAETYIPGVSQPFNIICGVAVLRLEAGCLPGGGWDEVTASHCRG